MVQITIFAGHDGQLRSDKLFYFTLFAGCDLVRPTAARQAQDYSERRRANRPPPPRPFFLTIFAGVDIKSPTMAEEYLDLREMLSAGALTLDDWERAIGRVSSSEGSIGSLTLFGGMGENEIPSESEEIEALALHRHLGNISDEAGRVLQYGIGQHNAERYSIVRQAVLAGTA